MEMISVILLLVVLLSQIVLFVLFFLEKRSSDRKNTATIAYIDHEVSKFGFDCAESFNGGLEAIGRKFGERIDELEKERKKDRDYIMQSVQNSISEYDKNKSLAFDAINEKLRELALDYTEAQEAAGKVNTFASSLAHIFDYDPISASKRNRKKEMG